MIPPIIAAIGLSILPYGLITTQGGTPFRWNLTTANNQAAYYINSTNEPYGGASSDLQAALQVWTQVNPSIFAWQYAGTTAQQGFVGNGIGSISFNDPNGDLPGGVLAATVPWAQGSHSSGGTTFVTITEMDMVFNNGINFVANNTIGGGCSNLFSLEAIALHEAGHGLGLAHPDQVDPNYTGGYNGAVMYSSIAPCDNGKGSLRTDDINGVNYLYGNGATGSAPSADFTSDFISGRQPLTIIFQNLTQGVVSTYTWDFGDSVLTSEVNPTHEYLYEGIYTVTLTAQGPGGSNLHVKTAYIEVKPKKSDGGGSAWDDLVSACQCTLGPRPRRGPSLPIALLGVLAGTAVLMRRRRD